MRWKYFILKTRRFWWKKLKTQKSGKIFHTHGFEELILLKYPKDTYKWPIDKWKNTQPHSESGKYKSKPQWDSTSYQSERLKLTSQEIDVGKDAEKEECSYTLGGNASWYTATLENNIEVLQEVKNRATLLYPAIVLLGIYPKNTHIMIQRSTCTLMFIAAISTKAKL